MSSLTRSTVLAAAWARAAFSRLHACHGPSKNCGPPGCQLEHRRRHGLEEPAVVRDEDHAGVECRELPLEPLEALDVEVVRRLVQQDQVGIARERPRQRRACQLTTRERRELAIEVGVAETEPAQHRRRPVAPRPAAAVLQPGLGLRVPAQRPGIVRSGRHRLLQRAELGLDRDQVGGAGQRVLAQREVAIARRPLVVERDPRSLGERELATLERRLARERAQQRRLARPVRTRQREPVAPPDGERDPVEQRVAGQLLAQVRCDHDSHEREA